MNMTEEQETKNDGRIILKYTMGENSLLSVRSFAKSILAFTRLQEAIAKDLKYPKMEVLITDLSCFEENGRAHYVIETQIIPKDAKIVGVHFEPNIEGKYSEKKAG